MEEKEKHTIEYIKDNWRCLSIFCQFEPNINPTKILNDLLEKFLIENKSKMKIYLERQQRIVDARSSS